MQLPSRPPRERTCSAALVHVLGSVHLMQASTVAARIRPPARSPRRQARTYMSLCGAG